MATQDTGMAPWWDRIWDRGLQTFERWADYDLFRDQLDIVNDARAFEGQQNARDDVIAQRSTGGGLSLGGVDPNTLLLAGGALLIGLVLLRRI